MYTNSMKFPHGFLWGTAMSAHQTEGNGINCDWSEWEKRKKPSNKYPLEQSGIACDSYTRYEEDFELCKKLNNNCVRISLAWNRLEPKEDFFDMKEVEHYRKVLVCARDKGLKTFVTLHHFTNPTWFSKKGGWTTYSAPKTFADYAKFCARNFGDLTDYYITINEPQVYALMSYTNGTWPPNKRNPILSLICQINFIRAHKLAYRAIKAITDKPISIAKNIVWYDTAHDGKFIDSVLAKFLFFLNCDFFLKPIKNYLDFIGVNFYFTTHFKNLQIHNKDDWLSDMGWWINPKGLENVLLALKKYRKPIVITENGTADSKDSFRTCFLTEMLTACHKAIKRGVDLHGYCHWSLIDNYEWHQGYWPKFGLVEIERYNNLKRTPRKSFYYYATICSRNEIL
jgi:beta-glucosidase